jgi:hypothetical protein
MSALFGTDDKCGKLTDRTVMLCTAILVELAACLAPGSYTLPGRSSRDGGSGRS